MNIQELNELDFGNIGVWPAPVKIILILIICALVVGGWYYLDTQDQLVNLERVEKEERGLRETFETKQAKAIYLGGRQSSVHPGIDEVGISF